MTIKFTVYNNSIQFTRDNFIFVLNVVNQVMKERERERYTVREGGGYKESVMKSAVGGSYNIVTGVATALTICNHR